MTMARIPAKVPNYRARVRVGSVEVATVQIQGGFDVLDLASGRPLRHVIGTGPRSEAKAKRSARYYAAKLAARAN
jgi:hypothetical protein